MNSCIPPRRGPRRLLGLLGLLGLLSATTTSTSAVAAPPAAEHLTFEDGMQAVVLPMPGSGQVSMRFVLRVGAKDDFARHAGLAHVVEHLVFHGTYQELEGKIFEDVYTKNAFINAYTSTDLTMYVLDADKASFRPLAERYLKLVTNPALRLAKLDREKQVIDGEHQLRSVRSVVWALDQQLFPSLNEGRTVIGSRLSRKDISMVEVLKFYRQHYRPENVVAVFTGDITVDEAKSILDEGVLFPPQRAAVPTPETMEPNVPSEIKMRSPMQSVAVGYAMDNVDEDTCRGLAMVAERRLMQAVVIDQPIAQHTDARCVSLRGKRLLLAVAFTSSPSSTELPEAVQSVVRGLRLRPPKARELKAIQKRQRTLVKRMHREPALAADAISWAVGAQGANAADAALRALRPVPLSKRKLDKAAVSQIVPDKRFLLLLSPYEG